VALGAGALTFTALLRVARLDAAGRSALGGGPVPQAGGGLPRNGYEDAAPPGPGLGAAGAATQAAGLLLPAGLRALLVPPAEGDDAEAAAAAAPEEDPSCETAGVAASEAQPLLEPDACWPADGGLQLSALPCSWQPSHTAAESEPEACSEARGCEARGSPQRPARPPCALCRASPLSCTIVHGGSVHSAGLCDECADTLECRGEPCPFCGEPVDRFVTFFEPPM
jgi:hypothetical protein